MDYFDYILAFELKKAGFPQIPPENDDRGVQFIATDDGRAYIPTLEQLVAACGDGFLALIKQHGTGMWEATSKNETKGLGPTFSIAVARLWISLQEKK